jgi:cell division septation protein DedD
MEAPLKQRLIGAVVLAALALIFIPMLLKSPDVQDADNANVSLQIPDEPDQDGIKTIDIPLGGSAQIVEQPIANPMTTSSDASNSVQENLTESADDSLPTPKAEAAGTAAGQYSVVFSAKSDVESQTLLAGLKAKGLNAKVQSNGKLFRVNVGPYDSREQAELARLRANSVASGGTVVAMDAVVKPKTSTVDIAIADKPSTPEKVLTPVTPTKADVIDASKAYAVQIGAPASEAAAIELRDKARAAGYPSFVQPVDTDSGRRYRVRVGPEHSRDEASLLLIAIKQKLGIEGFVVAHP